MGVQKRRLTIPAVIDKIEKACNFVDDTAREAGLGEDAVYHCHLSVEEILTNIIEHGYKYQSGQYIDVECGIYSDRFSITIIDNAQQFDPLKLPEPDPHTPLMEREDGGWGVYFVKRYMDRIHYTYSGSRNHLTLEKDLT